MTDDECKKCGNTLKPSEDWILRDPNLLGTTADGPLNEAYMHRECATDEHIARIMEAANE